MKIYGTKLEIKKTFAGELFSNINNPSMEMVMIEKSAVGSSAYYLLETMLKICRKQDDNKDYLGKWAVANLASKDAETLSQLGYGNTWNFKSVVENNDIYDYIKARYIDNSTHLTEIENNTHFEHTTNDKVKRARTRKKPVFASNDNVVPTKTFDLDALKIVVDKLINFFSEFDFEPNYRFINTLSRNCTNKKSATKYIHNYFALIDSSYVNEIDEKMKSAEFETIYDGLAAQTTEKVINNRFKIYYGAQGTGKTTKACEEADNCVIVCNNSMLPADLMQDFDFDDGKAAFKSSALYNAIVNGKTIVLDEINLLPFESLRFLQGIVDGKSSFVYKNKEVKIADGFKIIGTMNLFVNGMAYALPSPLVDRCESIEEFKLTANDLIYAIA